MENIKFIRTTGELEGLPQDLAEKLNRDLQKVDAGAYIETTLEYVDISCIAVNVKFTAILLTPEQAKQRANDTNLHTAKYKLFADNLITSSVGQTLLVETDNEETRELLEVMKSYR